VADLGALWEAQTALPLPLGAIVIRRDLGEELQRKVENLLAESIRFAFENPTLSRTYIKTHAQEMEDDVIDRHIALFVNEFSLSLGEEGRRATAQLTGLDL
jgi:1,4-dihydroxy-6-naphthoate synthase